MGTTASNNQYSLTASISSGASFSGRTLSYSATLVVNTGNTYYSQLNSSGSLSGTGASTATHNGNYSLNGNNTSTTVLSISGSVAAAANGNASVSISGTWGSDYPVYYNGYQIGMSAVTATDSATYHVSTPPSTPTIESGPTRTVNAASVTMSTVTSYWGSGTDWTGAGGKTPLTYRMQIASSPNNSTWTDGELKTSTSSRTFSFTGLSQSTYYRFTAAAQDADGIGGSVTSSSIAIPTIPGAPSVTPGVPAGRSITVTASGASTGSFGTTTIADSSLSYFIQISPDNGVTWKNNAQLLTTAVNGTDQMTGASGTRSFTYTNLSGGSTYRFRVYVTNEMGTGATTTTASPGVYIPSAGKRYDGTSFVVIGTAKRRNGTNTAWEPITTAKKYLVSQQITNAVGNGTSVTFTANNTFNAGANNRVTITGVTPAAYNLTNVVVTAATATTFTVTSSATGTFTSSLPTSNAVGWFDFV